LCVFLCHSSGDKATIRELYSRLKADGIQPWLDEEDLIPGQDWREEIEKSVETCDVVLVCLSPESITKEGYVQHEIKVALDVADYKPEGTIFVIPVKLRECEIPRRLRQWQWVNYFEERGYERLVRALKARAEELPKITISAILPQTPPPPPPREPTIIPGPASQTSILAQFNQAEAEQDWDTVIELGETLLSKDKNHRLARQKISVAYNKRAALYYRDGDNELAIADLTRAIELNPKHDLAYYNRGCIHYTLLDKEAARRDFHEAANLNNVRAKEVLAKLEMAERKAREAEEARQKQLADLSARLEETVAGPDWRRVLELGQNIMKLDKSILEGWLDSDNLAYHWIAGEVLLDHRLRTLERIDERREIDLNYLTCAEYQLFLDEMRKQKNFCQPDHWLEYRFPKGQASQPVFGVRARDAEAFCEWLTNRTGQGVCYRLPQPAEAEQYPVLQPQDRTTWCKDGLQFRLIGLTGSFEQATRQELTGFLSSDLPIPPSLDLDPDGRYRALKFTRASALDNALDNALELTRASALHLIPARALAHTLALDLRCALGHRPPDQRYSVLGVPLPPDPDLSLVLVFNRDLKCDLKLTRASALDRAHHLTRSEKITEALRRNDLAGAKRLAQEPRSRPFMFVTPLDKLLVDLLDMAMAQTVPEAIRARWRYLARIAEYIYIGVDHLGIDEIYEYKKDRQIILELYWWLQIVMARADGKLPAWEGIRIVRETAS
jgi:hypothetical protein